MNFERNGKDLAIQWSGHSLIPFVTYILLCLGKLNLGENSNKIAIPFLLHKLNKTLPYM